MKKSFVLALLPMLAACSSDPSTSPGADAPANTTPDRAEAEAPTSAPDAGEDPSRDASSGGDRTPTPQSCTAAKEQLLKPVDTVSSGDVVVLSDAAGVKTLYVDASAGGAQGQATSPRVYLDLTAAKRVAVTDVTAGTSTDWDIALKRPVLFVNGGDGGPGDGGAVQVSKDFAVVTASDVATASFAAESFFGADCEPKLDPSGAVRTSFEGWYDYDTSTNRLSPHAGTWLVRGAKGRYFKVRILSYYASPDGGEGAAGGRFTLAVAAL